MKRRQALILPLLALLVSSCGGGSRGLSGDMPVFNTVTVTPVAVDPPVLESDVIVRQNVNRPVRTNPPACNVIEVQEVCAGTIFVNDNLRITFKSDTIKNAAGQPVTLIPSPVMVQSYTVSFSSCIPGTYQFPVNVVLQPGEEKPLTIQPITADMKRQISTDGQFVFVSQDGCPTPFNVRTYQGICNAVANLEFELLELNSGIRRRISYPLTVRLSDFTTGDDQCTR